MGGGEPIVEGDGVGAVLGGVDLVGDGAGAVLGGLEPVDVGGEAAVTAVTVIPNAMVGQCPIVPQINHWFPALERETTFFPPI